MSLITQKPARLRTALAASLLIAGSFLVACGDDDGGDGDTTPTTTATATATATESATATADATETGTPGSEDAAADIEATFEAILTALSEGDLETFGQYWTDNGIQAEFGAPKEEFLAQPPEEFATPAELQSVENIEVDGDSATAEMTMVLGGTLDSGLYTLVNQDGTWMVDGSEQLVAEIPDGVTAVPVEMVDFAFEFDPAAVTDGNIAFETTNTGEQAHEMVFVRVAEGVDLMAALESATEGPPEGIEMMGFLMSEPGEDANMVFEEPLEAGNYAMVCFFPDVNDPEETPHALKGMVSELEVPAGS